MGLWDEVQRAVARGAALASLAGAACSGTVMSVHDAGAPSRLVLTDGGAVVDYDGGAACHQRPPYDNPMFYSGSCCPTLHCEPARAGTCRSLSEMTYVDLQPTWPSSMGRCTCSSPRGPFASADGGECCYEVESVACLGRPLVDGDTAVVAAVVTRSDWA